MKHTAHIPVSHICTYYGIQEDFIRRLSEFELLHLVRDEHEEYLPEDELRTFERYIRLYRDLNINPEGIEAVSRLLQRITELQREIDRLRSMML
jgi:hypothetical protein